MSDYFMGQIMMTGFGFAQKNFAQCNGQLMAITQNQALFSLLGTTYGGNGQTNFALPDLRGRMPMHMGAGHTLGEKAGEQAHTLTLPEIPQHSHAMAASGTTGQATSGNGNLPAAARGHYAQSGNTTMPALLANVGGSQPHLNMPPYLPLSFCMAMQGIFPSQT